MKTLRQVRTASFTSTAIGVVLGLSLFSSAQTLTVLHAFTGPHDGSLPTAGVTLDQIGNLYGVTHNGGIMSACVGQGCGVVFKLAHHSDAWILDPLYEFKDTVDGAYPQGNVIVAADGTLYSTALNALYGCGIAYRLQPSTSICHGASCPWTQTVLHWFTGNNGDGCSPWGAQVMASGDLYGATGSGVVYELVPGQGQWTENILGSNGSGSVGGVIRDSAGNLYGVSDIGGTNNYGMVFELVRSGSGWTVQTLASFGSGNGQTPAGGLVMDAEGNIFGTTSMGGANNGGTVFELTPSGTGWTLTTIYAFSYQNGQPRATLALDPHGNLYGTTNQGPGTVFKLTPGAGGWTYTLIHSFLGGSNDGAYPTEAGVTLDASGNLFGTTTGGGGSLNCPQGCGTVYEITP